LQNVAYRSAMVAERESEGAGEWFWKGCKPNFVCALRRRESFVSATNTRNPAAFAAQERAAPGSPIWSCTRRGFPCRVAFASRGALLPHLFTITGRGLRPGRLSVFCGTVRRNTLRCSSRVYPGRYGPGLRGVVPCGVRTFLPRLAPGAILHPSKTKDSLVYFWESSSGVDGNKQAITLGRRTMEPEANKSLGRILSPLRGERESIETVSVRCYSSRVSEVLRFCLPHFAPHSAAVKLMSCVKYKIRPQFWHWTISAWARQLATIWAGSFMWQPPQALCSIPTTTFSPLFLNRRS
jgi:hypothetical protein